MNDGLEFRVSAYLKSVGMGISKEAQPHMSTRGAIARPLAGDAGWEGRFHHWDSYPRELGKTLYGLYHGQYGGDHEAMIRGLIDDHPKGWSSLNGDTPSCYCHSPEHQNTDAAFAVRDDSMVRCVGGEPEDDASAPLMIEWVYVLAKMGMDVLANFDTGEVVKMEAWPHDGTRFYESSRYAWRHVGFIPWSSGEVDWAGFEKEVNAKHHETA